MYRYSPPKSSVWGHALGKMAPARQKQLFQEFLERATASHHAASASLLIAPMDRVASETVADVTQFFENLLQTTALNGYFPDLTGAQFDQCFEAICARPNFLQSPAVMLLLCQRVHIIQWRIDGADIPTKSSFHLHYGSSPRVSTFLAFDSPDQFRQVQKVLAELRFCRLNEKHLKLVKRTGNARK